MKSGGVSCGLYNQVTGRIQRKLLGHGVGDVNLEECSNVWMFPRREII